MPSPNMETDMQAEYVGSFRTDGDLRAPGDRGAQRLRFRRRDAGAEAAHTIPLTIT